MPCFWQIAYHAAFCAHLLMVPDAESFKTWEKHREDDSGGGQAYSQAEVLEYCGVIDRMIDATIDRVDVASASSGFPWYEMPKLDNEILCIRHVAQHAGQLDALLRLEGIEPLDWQT